MRRNVTRTGAVDKELVSSVDGVKIKDIIVGNKVLKTMEVDRDPALSCTDQTTPFLLSPKVKDQNVRGVLDEVITSGTLPK